MIKKTFCILILLGTVAAVTFAALNSSKSQSVLMKYIETTEPAELVAPCDSIPCDSLTVQH